MSLSFLPTEVLGALAHLNFNHVSEIRIRRGQPVIIEYKGSYKYINKYGISDSANNAIIVREIEPIIFSATNGCVYNFTEQMKSGFITVEHGVRIGIAGEYVTQNEAVNTIKDITSLNIRIPHNIVGCANFIVRKLLSDGLKSFLLFSKPGLGKTTMLRDIAIHLSNMQKYNILVFDERNEISGICTAEGYNLGDRVDIIRCYEKKSAISSAIRAMKPNVIITDELYGDRDMQAIKFVSDCGITVIASSHICNRDILKKMPFDYFVHIEMLGASAIYDKNFNFIDRSDSDDVFGGVSIG